jgi:hypothetical protein
MVKVPNQPATTEATAQMQSITLRSNERKDLIREMKRERKPSRRLRMHIVLLASDGYSPVRIARVLFCSRTTIYYAIVARFATEGRAAFADRKRRGPRSLLDGSAHDRIEALLEEGWPPAHGFGLPGSLYPMAGLPAASAVSWGPSPRHSSLFSLGGGSSVATRLAGKGVG